MRPSHLLIWLTLCLETFALNAAAPFELLYFYSAYKIEWTSLDSSGRTIATGCRHSPNNFPAGESAYAAAATAAGVKGICTFDEFVKYVGRTQSFIRYRYTAATITPDPATIKVKFQQTFGVYPALAYDPAKLLPTWASVRANTPLTPIIKQITNAVQTAREVVTDANALVATEVANSKSYLQIIQQLRLKDQMKFMGQAITGFLRQTSFTTLKYATDDINYPNGNKFDQYQRIDYDGTIATEPGATQNEKVALRTAIETYGTSTPQAPSELAQRVQVRGGYYRTSYLRLLDEEKKLAFRMRNEII
ncbi:MAG: hypothetical protein M1818_008497 [Claussenomyces sp. TS43310]|nr:MAG: hypothetical protein M1818_008497 [Claussenomyces sp. TS43310]